MKPITDAELEDTANRGSWFSGVRGTAVAIEVLQLREQLRERDGDVARLKESISDKLADQRRKLCTETDEWIAKFNQCVKAGKQFAEERDALQKIISDVRASIASFLPTDSNIDERDTLDALSQVFREVVRLRKEMGEVGSRLRILDKTRERELEEHLQQRDSLQRRVEELDAALRKYGEHFEGCATRLLRRCTCTCGFDAALNQPTP